MLFLGAYKFNVCFGHFSKITAPSLSPWVAQDSLAAAQKTPWLALF
jgi:hypothetical protein